MGKRSKVVAKKSKTDEVPKKKVKTNGHHAAENGSKDSGNSDNSKRGRAKKDDRKNPRPEGIDADLWPEEDDFVQSDLANMKIVRSVLIKQMKRIEQELFREDHNNELAGIQTQVESPSKGPITKPNDAEKDTGNNNNNNNNDKGQNASSSSSSSTTKTTTTTTTTTATVVTTTTANSNAPTPDSVKENKDSTTSKSKTEDDNKKEDDMYDEWKPPPFSVPICTDVRHLPVQRLKDQMLKTRGQLFDVIMMDPPWQLATANPTRGVAIGYQQLADFHIKELPVRELQTDGFIFIWVINAKFRFALSLLEYWGYELVDEIVWIKQTVNRRMAKSHGFYLQHAKETCLVGRKGKHPKNMVGGIASDVIYSIRRGQSQKPEEIYKYVEQLVPNGHYLEIFGRRNNLHDYWVTVGNEL